MRLLLILLIVFCGCNGNDFGGEEIKEDTLPLTVDSTTKSVVKFGDWQSLEHDWVILIVDGDTTKHMGDTITVTTCKYGCNDKPKIKKEVAFCCLGELQTTGIKNVAVGWSGGDDDTVMFNMIGNTEDSFLHSKGDSSLKTGWLSLGDITSTVYCDSINWKAKYDSLILKLKQFHPE